MPFGLDAGQVNVTKPVRVSKVLYSFRDKRLKAKIYFPEVELNKTVALGRVRVLLLRVY